MKSDVELDKTCLHVFMGHVYGLGIYSGTHYVVPCFPKLPAILCVWKEQDVVGGEEEVVFLMFLLGVIWRRIFVQTFLLLVRLLLYSFVFRLLLQFLFYLNEGGSGMVSA